MGRLLPPSHSVQHGADDEVLSLEHTSLLKRSDSAYHVKFNLLNNNGKFIIRNYSCYKIIITTVYL